MSTFRCTTRGRPSRTGWCRPSSRRSGRPEGGLPRTARWASGSSSPARSWKRTAAPSTSIRAPTPVPRSPCDFREARPPPRRSSRSTGRPSGARRKDTRRTEGPTSEPMSAPSAFHAGAAPRVALFATCLADRFFADACADAVRVLRHLGVEVEVPVGQTCCGQPAHSTGNREEAVRMARHTLATFADADHVVLPSGSCAAMLRRSYGELLGTPAAAALGARTWELAQFLVHILGAAAGPLGTGLAGRRVAYH